MRELRHVEEKWEIPIAVGNSKLFCVTASLPDLLYTYIQLFIYERLTFWHRSFTFKF
jgi:hypothetical protein